MIQKTTTWDSSVLTQLLACCGLTLTPESLVVSGSSFVYTAEALEQDGFCRLVGTVSDDGAKGHAKAKVISKHL